MFKLLREWRHQRIFRRSTVSSGSWDNAFQQVPLLDHLSEEERTHLRRLAILFLHEKSFVGAHDLKVSEEMQLLIAEYKTNKSPFSHFSQVSPGCQKGGKPTLWGDFDLNPASLVGKHSHFSTIFGRLHTRRPSATLPRRLRSQPMRLVGRACVSVEQAGLWRRTARRQPRGFCRGVLFVEVSENLLDHHRVFVASDDPDRATASLTGLDVDVA